MSRNNTYEFSMPLKVIYYYERSVLEEDNVGEKKNSQVENSSESLDKTNDSTRIDSFLKQKLLTHLIIYRTNWIF